MHPRNESDCSSLLASLSLAEELHLTARVMAESPDVCCEQCSDRTFVSCNVRLADTYPRLLLLYFVTLYASVFLCNLTCFSY